MGLNYNSITLNSSAGTFSSNGNGDNGDNRLGMLTYNQILCNYLWIKNKVLTQDEINEVNSALYKPEWDGNTLLLCVFNHNLNSGNLTSNELTESVTYWHVYVRQRNNQTLKYLGKVNADEFSLKDFNVVNDSEYQYVIFAETENTLSPLFETDYVKTCWDAWSLIDLKEIEENGVKSYVVDENNIWLFNTNLQSGELKQNIDKNIIDNFTQFPKILVGQKNYISSNITAFLSNVIPNTGKYVDTAEMMEQFKSMVNNGNLKILKDRKGNGWIVDITENAFEIIDKSYEQIVKVDFSFVQVKDL